MEESENGDTSSDADRELYTLQGSVAIIYIGEMGKVRIFRCQVSSGCRAPKIIEIGRFFSWSYSKNKK